MNLEKGRGKKIQKERSEPFFYINIRLNKLENSIRAFAFREREREREEAKGKNMPRNE